MNPSYLSSVSFSFYTAEEIRKMSVKEITTPVAFDTLGQPVPQGLYDPSMGISPYDSLSICPTCGQERDHCPGHPGHIELPLPIFNPFLFPNMMYKLFKAKCWYCHKLRIEPHKLNYM